MSRPIKHLLVIRLSALGDVAMTIPVLSVLSSSYPQLQITVLTRKQFAPLYEHLENVAVYEADLKGKHKGLLGLRRLSIALKVFDFDAVADFHNVLRTHILKLFFLKRPFIQIDKGRKEKKALITGKQFGPLKSTHERYADVLRALGFELDLSEYKFPAKRDLNSKTKAEVGSLENAIGIAPFAAFQGKMYPLSLMDEVIKTLSHKHKVILFGGGASEIAQLEAIVQSHNNVINLAGKLNLTEELDVISNLQLMIAMDSGNAHMAAMLGIKTLTLWGVTHPYAGFAPFKQPDHHMILADRDQYPKIPTSVYGNKWPEGYSEVMASIPPQKIIDKVKILMQP